MIEAKGTVVAVDDDYVVVRMDDAGCGRCHEDGGCGGNHAGNMFCSKPKTYRVPNSAQSTVGDQVVIEVEEGSIRRSAVRMYVIPLLGLLGGAQFGLIVGGEVGAISGAVAGLICAWLITRCVFSQNLPLPRIKK